jgi:hypothetical protein
MTPELLPVWCWAMPDSFSSTVTVCPRLINSTAVASPRIPAPATMTVTSHWLMSTALRGSWGRFTLGECVGGCSQTILSQSYSTREVDLGFSSFFWLLVWAFVFAAISSCYSRSSPISSEIRD